MCHAARSEMSSLSLAKRCKNEGNKQMEDEAIQSERTSERVENRDARIKNYVCSAPTYFTNPPETFMFSHVHPYSHQSVIHAHGLAWLGLASRFYVNY